MRYFYRIPARFVIAITIPIPIPMQTVHQMCIIGKFALSVVTCQPFNIICEKDDFDDCFIHFCFHEREMPVITDCQSMAFCECHTNTSASITYVFNIDKSIRFCFFFFKLQLKKIFSIKCYNKNGGTSFESHFACSLYYFDVKNEGKTVKCYFNIPISVLFFLVVVNSAKRISVHANDTQVYTVRPFIDRSSVIGEQKLWCHIKFVWFL